MAELKYRMRFTAAEASSILARFIKRYVDTEKLQKYILLWNSLFDGLTVKCLPIDEIENLPFEPDKAVLFYDERQKIFCSTTIKDVIDYVQSFDPWDEVDACLFDQDMDWAAAITHEDRLLCWGSIDMG